METQKTHFLDSPIYVPMKRIHIYLICSLFLFASSGLQAQISIGFNAGPSFSTLVNGEKDPTGFDDLIKSGYSPGLNFSIPMEFTLSIPFALQSELNFLQKGTVFRFEEIEGSDNYTKYRGQNKLNYVQVPLLMKVKTGKGAFRTSFYAGPGLSFLISGNSSTRFEALIDGEYFTEESKDAIDLKDTLNRWELSAILGIGLELDTGLGAITLDMRYQHGLTNIVKDPQVELKVRNQGFTAGLGYKINL